MEFRDDEQISRSSVTVARWAREEWRGGRWRIIITVWKNMLRDISCHSKRNRGKRKERTYCRLRMYAATGPRLHWFQCRRAGKSASHLLSATWMPFALAARILASALALWFWKTSVIMRCTILQSSACWTKEPTKDKSSSYSVGVVLFLM